MQSKKQRYSIFKFAIKSSRLSKVIFLLIWIYNLNSMAQTNLVPNPSFEEYKKIPSSLTDFPDCKDWRIVFLFPSYFSDYSPLYLPPTNTICSANTIQNAFGSQKPRTGNFYAGIILKSVYLNPPPELAFIQFFNMIGCKLKKPLVKDHLYEFTLHYSLAENSAFISNQFSAYFSDTLYDLTHNFPSGSQNGWDTRVNSVNPQINLPPNQFISKDTIDWQRLNGCFISKGNEQYLTIGCFRDALKTNTMAITSDFVSPCNASKLFIFTYIDDVSLYDRGFYSGKVKVKPDTLLCKPVSYQLGVNEKDSSSYEWTPHEGLSCWNCPNPIASPSVTTTYRVKKYFCENLSSDSVSIVYQTCKSKYNVPTIFTPNNDGVNDFWKISFDEADYITSFNLLIYNRWGQQVFESKDINAKWMPQYSNSEKISSGTFFYTAEFKNNNELTRIKGTIEVLK
jgi:gliding motility-associated-like protein